MKIKQSIKKHIHLKHKIFLIIFLNPICPFAHTDNTKKKNFFIKGEQGWARLNAQRKSVKNLGKKKYGFNKVVGLILKPCKSSLIFDYTQNHCHVNLLNH